MLWWIVVAGIVLFAIAFLFIARAGRKLRTTHVLPEEATQARLESADGKQYGLTTANHFYLGKDPGNQIVLSNANGQYSVCIFHHRNRFAFQTLSGSSDVRLNGEEQPAGYLFDGDVLTIAGESFTFRSVTQASRLH